MTRLHALVWFVAMLPAGRHVIYTVLCSLVVTRMNGSAAAAFCKLSTVLVHRVEVVLLCKQLVVYTVLKGSSFVMQIIDSGT